MGLFWKWRCATAHRHFSGFLYKSLSTLWTGDGYFPLPSWDTDGLSAFGAVKVPVLPVFDTVNKHQIFAIFLIPLVGVSGQGAAYCPDHKSIGKGGQKHVDQRETNEHGNQTGDDTCSEDRHIQLVRAVAAHHKSASAGADSCAQAAQPISKTVHVTITLLFDIHYYIANRRDFNQSDPMFTDCLILGEEYPRQRAGDIDYSFVPSTRPFAIPTRPCISLGIMILVALPSAIFCIASMDFSLMT